LSHPDTAVEAFAHHLAGRRDEAELVCRELLEKDPRDHAALHVLALMAQAQKRPAVALKLAQMAVSIVPGVPDYRNTLGAVLSGHPTIRQNYARIVDPDSQQTDSIGEIRFTVRGDYIGEGSNLRVTLALDAATKLVGGFDNHCGAVMP
jgi:hypothetical protein